MDALPSQGRTEASSFFVLVRFPENDFTGVLEPRKIRTWFRFVVECILRVPAGYEIACAYACNIEAQFYFPQTVGGAHGVFVFCFWSSCSNILACERSSFFFLSLSWSCFGVA